MMRYASNEAVQAPEGKSSGVKIAIIVVVSVIIFISVCAIGLGVGLGIGLKKKNSSSSSVTSIGDRDYNSSACGYPAIQPTLSTLSKLSIKIANGYSATPHSWPWMVVLYYNGEFICAGFLANSYQFVITAAGCLYGTNQSLMQIYAGVDTLSSRADAQVRNVANWEINPNYNTLSADTFNDIAVIKLTSSFDKNDYVNLCCLPDGSTQLPIIGESAVIAGWGTTISDLPSSGSNNLLQAVIQVEGSSGYCNVSTTSAVEFCAGYDAFDSCPGDGGGPLMTNINNLWTCTGIVSHGIGCGHSSYYTRVSAFISFINNAINTL